MSFTFLDELGVEPLAFVGQPTDIVLYVPNAIHKLYSGTKTNVLTRYTKCRYINTPEDQRFINTGFDNRFIQTNREDCS